MWGLCYLEVGYLGDRVSGKDRVFQGGGVPYTLQATAAVSMHPTAMFSYSILWVHGMDFYHLIHWSDSLSY